MILGLRRILPRCRSKFELGLLALAHMGLAGAAVRDDCGIVGGVRERRDSEGVRSVPEESCAEGV